MIESHDTSGVNEGDRWRKAKKKRLEGVTATLSLLSEGEVFCDECGGRIDAAAIYVTKKRPGYAPAHDLEIIALLHPGCYGWKDDE